MRITTYNIGTSCVTSIRQESYREIYETEVYNNKTKDICERDDTEYFIKYNQIINIIK